MHAMKSKQLIMLVAVAVVIVAAAVFYFVGRSNESAIPVAGAAPVAAAASGTLMTPGPLGDMALGDPKAPNVVIEYASLTCPHCQRFHQEIYPEFKKRYIDTGKVYFIFREFPRDPLDTSAFMLAHCGPKERFFPLVDLLFDQQKTWAFVNDPVTALFGLVKQAGFTEDSFKACLTNQQILDGVNAVRDRASKDLAVEATPTFFFNGEKKPGEQSLEDIQKIIGS
jgi:protein-disulfide isomerase